MPVETYSSLPSTVLAYKREHQIGRFNPAAPELQQKKVEEMWAEVERRGTHMLFSRLFLFSFFLFWVRLLFRGLRGTLLKGGRKINRKE
jgi:hypothetical protein